ncbi:3-deoxy-7-phosphoheptulonate synthase [Paenibacillus oenotherae]|uniref:3-deoxy-7-phosphoheptulonate synthase n=1 Tax=Paenibacillus oenotherae TaxID=1435645 RepID=A0ABS7D0K9_9BACL|nr:3-deoxy-7-phosphoheptulonate synthase [Paenibacillus oenotherae]MBW7473364.1 3-deoxy-7-phosphoheptulonate synthase [Paenibacillus oenotherae]
MIVITESQMTAQSRSEMMGLIEEYGFKAKQSPDLGQDVTALYGKGNKAVAERLRSLPDVKRVTAGKPYTLADREYQRRNTVIRIGGLTIGSDSLAVIAGPGRVRSYEHLSAIASWMKRCGAQILRGEFVVGAEEGMDIDGLRMMKEVAQQYGLTTLTTVPGPRQVEQCAAYADILAVGVRNMQNRDLHNELGDLSHAVLLRRGLSATYADMLNAADYILQRGNPNVILLERGIRTYEPYTDSTLDIAAVPALQTLSHLPVFVDATHSAARGEMVVPLARAAVAAGASGVFLGFDLGDPDSSRLALAPEPFAELMRDFSTLAPVAGGQFLHGGDAEERTTIETK